MFPGGIGPGEIMIILIVAVVLFGKNLPNVARNLGQSYQQFRRSLGDLQSSFRVEDDDPSTRRSPARAIHHKDANDRVVAPIAPRFEPDEDSVVANQDGGGAEGKQNGVGQALNKGAVGGSRPSESTDR